MLGIGQIIAWGSSYLLMSVLARPIAQATGWPMSWVVGSLSLGLLTSGIVSPQVGKLIDRHGGRPMLAGSAIVLGIGLLILSAAPTLPVFLAGWIVIGVGMGMGLYDPAFSTLGRLYGQDARSSIAVLTMFGGFSGTFSWPVSAFLVEHVGWRGACVAYAAINLAILLPGYWFALPREPRREPVVLEGGRIAGRVRPDQRAVFLLLAAGFTLAAAISTIISVYLLTILQARGLSLAAAVALGTLMGPTQVSIRFFEMAFGRKRHPIWSLFAGSLLVIAGVAMLIGAPEIMAVGIVLYAAGNGFRTMARATVPLAIFDREGYAALMGKLSLPTLILQAAAPSIAAVVLDHYGAMGVLVMLSGMAATCVLLALPLLPIALRRKSG